MSNKKNGELLKIKKVTRGNQDIYDITAKFVVKLTNKRMGYAYLRLK